jgi:phosphoribosylformylglycinamidine synthase subunit PurL
MALAANMGLAARTAMGTDWTTAEAFGEDQGRYLVASNSPIDGAVPVATVTGNSVFGVLLTDLRAAHESFFKDWMED